MDPSIKKKRAAESYGSQGMSKFIDSNEARRLSRLTNVRSTIGSEMQHNGWQKDQIEKRRKEQIRQKRQEAKKRPLGQGIIVDTAINPFDYTKTGLKLKLDQTIRREKPLEKKVSALSTRLRTDRTGSDSKRKGYGPKVSIQKSESPSPNIPGNNVQDDVHLLEDGSIINVESRESKERVQIPFIIEDLVQEGLKDLSLNSNVLSTRNETSKRRSLIPILNADRVRTIRSRLSLSTDEGKENETSRGQRNDSRAVNPKVQGGPRKHFQLHSDINALKREHADALKMLKELDREETRRRSMDSARSVDSDSRDAEPNASDGENEATETPGDKCSHSGGQKYFDVVEEIDIDRRSNVGGYGSEHPVKISDTVDANDNSFVWIPEGIECATHLSIILNDDFESQVETESNSGFDDGYGNDANDSADEISTTSSRKNDLYSSESFEGNIE